MRPARDARHAFSEGLGRAPASPPTRAAYRVAPREPFPWLAALVTLAVLAGAVLTIVYGPAPPLHTPTVRAPGVAPVAPTTAPSAPPAFVAGRLARAGASCTVLDAPGVDDSGVPTVCRATTAGLRWARR